jgi:hypothetical protein
LQKHGGRRLPFGPRGPFIGGGGNHEHFRIDYVCDFWNGKSCGCQLANRGSRLRDAADATDVGRRCGSGARKELAKELGYKGDMNDSASMNIWLHKQVMQKLAANGGKVPADLQD